MISTQDFDEYSELAMSLGMCFCMCKCQNEGVGRAAILGHPVPGLCDECKGRKGHERIATKGMWEAVHNPIDEPTKVERPVRIAAAADHARAVEYIEAVEPHTQELAVIADKVAAGVPLTARQVERALRAKATETRDYQRVHSQLMDEHQVRGTATDLTRLRIPETVQDGHYAVKTADGGVVWVEVSRTYGEALSGATVVTIHLGDEKRYGYQRRDYPGIRGRLLPAFYKGWFPQLVADLVADPDGARATYEDLAA